MHSASPSDSAIPAELRAAFALPAGEPPAVGVAVLPDPGGLFAAVPPPDPPPSTSGFLL